MFAIQLLLGGSAMECGNGGWTQYKIWQLPCKSFGRRLAMAKLQLSRRQREAVLLAIIGLFGILSLRFPIESRLYFPGDWVAHCI
jgi:hypothetical protein